MIGERIRARREELGMTQQELADRMGYSSRTTINKIEAGVNDISQSKVVAFAKALDTTVAYLMEWEEEDKQKAYYLNDETAEIAQAVFDDPDLRMLFHASRDCRPESIRLAAEMLRQMKETNPDG